jgi:flagellar protein FliS
MNPYFEQAVLSADPVELIRMIYHQAIVSLRDAREHLREKRIRERSAAILRAYAAIAELIGSLRPDTAPEISARLEGLYLYMQRRLLDANMQQADQPLVEVLGLLNTLEEAWTGVAEKLSTGNAGHAGIREMPARVDSYSSERYVHESHAHESYAHENSGGHERVRLALSA